MQVTLSEGRYVVMLDRKLAVSTNSFHESASIGGANVVVLRAACRAERMLLNRLDGRKRPSTKNGQTKAVEVWRSWIWRIQKGRENSLCRFTSFTSQTAERRATGTRPPKAALNGQHTLEIPQSRSRNRGFNPESVGDPFQVSASRDPRPARWGYPRQWSLEKPP